jgi:xanthine dehydrogenase accessory factor
MNENEYLAGTINQQMESGLPVVLVSIMSLEGSTPRHRGTKMVVGADGKSYGTIGGSLIEAAAIRESRDVLSAAKSRILSYDMTGKGAASPDMICGGTAEILLDYIPATEKNVVFSRYWLDMTQSGKDFYLITHLKGSGITLQVIRHIIYHSEGVIFDNSPIPEEEIATIKPEFHNITSTSVLTLKDTRVLVDRIRKLKTLYCFGGGHVAVPTAHLAALVGFRVVVTDDRSEFANAERFPDAIIRVINDYDKALEELEIDEDSFIVIVTRGHQYDRTVLEQSLKTRAGYIGMISSRKKRDAIYKALMADGADISKLEQVHSPIGIDIGGETPEEIAVSIVAELIQVRSQQTS